MKVSKLEEILNSFKDKDTEIILDVSRLYNCCLSGERYDLTTVSIENKHDRTVIKFGFEENPRTTGHKNNSYNRIKNMDISSYRDGMTILEGAKSE